MKWRNVFPRWESCEANGIEKLQHRLKEELTGKKFLVVMDDVWSKNYIDWTRLLVPFAAAASGSKVIFTTRSKDVASKMGSVQAYMLEGVSNEECLPIFTHHALDATNFDAHSDFKYVGEKIAEKCKGLPLAAQTLGGLLRHKQNLQEWEDVLRSEVWDLPEVDGGILPALRLSYCDLPSLLKQYFSYCAIFPKDYEYDEKELVLLWMAEGFLQQVEKKKAEDLGHQCFRDLSSWLLFLHSSRNGLKYVMHDSIVDLARAVSQETWFNLGDSQKDAFILERNSLNGAKIRHSAFSSYWYDTWQRFETLHQMKSLRTFLALQPSQSSGDYHLSNKVLDDLIPALRYLRAVSLTGYSFEELSDSFGGLKHLWYLNLSYSRIRRLPKSLSQLFNLQTLVLCGCSQLVELPKDIGNLINLHYLDISDTHALQEMPLQIRALTNLWSLPMFIVGEGTPGLGLRG